MRIRKMRLERGWSQADLAQLSGISTRTLQRLESGGSASIESLKALAAAFDVDFTELSEETKDMPQAKPLPVDEARIVKQVKDIKGFYHHLAQYGVMMVVLSIINIMTSSYPWVLWAALGWGVGVAMHALSVFEFFNFLGPDWERREIEKRLRNK